MEECRVVAINNLISYNPLSANVVMIQGKDALWLYDVGNHPDIPAIIDTYSNGRKVNAILSDFQSAVIRYLVMRLSDSLQEEEVYQFTEQTVLI